MANGNPIKLKNRVLFKKFFLKKECFENSEYQYFEKKFQER